VRRAPLANTAGADGGPVGRLRAATCATDRRARLRAPLAVDLSLACQRGRRDRERFFCRSAEAGWVGVGDLAVRIGAAGQIVRLGDRTAGGPWRRIPRARRKQGGRTAQGSIRPGGTVLVPSFRPAGRRQAVMLRQSVQRFKTLVSHREMDGDGFLPERSYVGWDSDGTGIGKIKGRSSRGPQRARSLRKYRGTRFELALTSSTNGRGGLEASDKQNSVTFLYLDWPGAQVENLISVLRAAQQVVSRPILPPPPLAIISTQERG
jgi:hypothetical protein